MFTRAPNASDESLRAPVGSPSDWMRTFACRLARRRPELSAAEVIDTAVREYAHAAAFPPEVAAERCRAGA